MSEIEEVKARLDIVDVVGQSVHLQKAGRTFKAPCPFHPEKTPSFVVNPDRQTWHCFGACATGGDVISFVMKREGIEFGEALRMLAERAGVKLKERRVSEEQDRARQRLYAANEAAAAYFQRQLTTDAGRAAREYIEKRRLDEATARSFGLGYSPAGWQDLLDHLRGLRFSDREITGAGLALSGESGLHDRFRNRLMFPVWDAKGRLIGFGARALDQEAQPKYLNTAQTALFDKSGTLYALNKAGESIRKEGRAVIVEGYMDVIAAHQHGYTNVVAQMGTALTERQYRLVKKLADKIVLVLDADAAGRDAMERVARENSASEPVQGDAQAFMRHAPPEQQADAGLLVAALPFGKDPDDLIRADSQAWPSLIDGARPYIDFWLDHIAQRSDLATPQGRTTAADEMMTLVGVIREPIIRAHYLQKVSRLVLLDEDSLNARSPQRQGPRTRPLASERRGQAAARGAKADAREAFLLALLVQYPQLRQAVAGEQVSPEGLLWDTEARQMYAIWLENDENAMKSAVPPELFEYFERLLLWKLPLSSEEEAAEALRDCVQKLDQRRLQAEKQAMAAQIADLQEKMGPSSLARSPSEGQIAADGGATETHLPDPEQSLELQELLQRDMEIGWKLHRKERRDGRLTEGDGSPDPDEGPDAATEGRQAVETIVDG